MEQIAIDGLTIAFERSGSGPPVLLLHGGISDSREWRRQIDALHDDFTVVAWDAPGCGRSSDPPESYRMPDYADCLASLVDTLQLDRPHVVGLSFGGTLALELYRRRPSLPRSLVLVSAYAGWAGSLPSEVVAERLEGALRESELAPQELARRWVAGLLGDRAPAGLSEELTAIISDAHRGGMRTMARAMADADLRDLLPRIAVPTLLLYGDADERSPLPLAESLASQIPGSRLVVLPGVGHQCNMEGAARFNTELRAFCRSALRES
jgi:pimeloyl-ACP methyl ester carboxylesterase